MIKNSALWKRQEKKARLFPLLDDRFKFKWGVYFTNALKFDLVGGLRNVPFYVRVHAHICIVNFIGS